MAKYTIELGKLIESGFYPFDETWTTFENKHKKELESKIINHYLFNEIGAETPSRFKHYINQQLREIMPYYNELYRSTLFDLAPLYNTIINRTTKGSSASSSSQQTVDRLDNESLRKMGESLNKDFKGNEWETKNYNQHGVKDTSGILNGDHNETESITKNGTDNYTKDTDETINKNTDTTSKEITSSREVLDGENKQTTTGNETQTANGVKWSSDTPQGEVLNNTLSINSKFLTNYESTTNSNNRNYNEDTNGTTDNITTLDKTVDETISTHETQDNNTVETMDDKTTETINRNKVNTDTETTKRNENETVTYNEEDHKNSINNEQAFSDKTEKENSSRIGSSAHNESGIINDLNNIDEKSSIGVSRAKLVQEYRNSIINIDLMIIRDLAVNFMGVF